MPADVILVGDQTDKQTAPKFEPRQRDGGRHGPVWLQQIGSDVLGNDTETEGLLGAALFSHEFRARARLDWRSDRSDDGRRLCMDGSIPWLRVRLRSMPVPRSKVLRSR
jgi:hypothetical protein